MAQNFGNSGCWKKISSLLKEIDISIDSLDQIPQLLHTYEREDHDKRMQVEKEYHERIISIEDMLRKTQDTTKQIIREKNLQTAQQISLLDQIIQQSKLFIAEKTKNQEQQLFLLVESLIDQLNELNNQIDLLNNKLNELEIIFKQQIVFLHGKQKPAWYNLIAKMKHYFLIRKQSAKLIEEYQMDIKPYQTKLLQLTNQRNALLNDKNQLQKQHKKQLETFLTPFYQEIDSNSLKKQKLTKELQHDIDVLHWNIQKIQKELTDFEQNKTLFVQEKMRNVLYKRNYLKMVRDSSDYKGAIAELEMIEYLKRLPNNYFVFNDITLYSYEYHYYHGKPLKSAQIDHLVLSSKGIFIIEVKYWSKKFTESKDYQNPYEQVERASTLCWFLLKDDFKNIKTRAVLAYKETIPQKDLTSRVKTLQIPYINQYITGNYFQDILTKHQLNELVNYFNGKMR